MNNSPIWIKAGYDLFAQEGHEGLQVERLARILGLNKSGFYHYFGNHDIYFEYLVQHHHEQVDRLVRDIGTIQRFDPDYLEVMLHHRDTVMATMQLVRNRHIKLFEKAFTETNHKIDQALLPIWSLYLGIPHQPELAQRYQAMVRDVFYSRVKPELMNYEFLHDLYSEAKSLVEEIITCEAGFLTIAS